MHPLRRLFAVVWRRRPGTSPRSASSQHLHPFPDDSELRTALPVGLPSVQFQPSLHENRRSLSQVFRCYLSRPPPQRDVDKRRLLDPIAVLVLPAIVDGHPDLGHRRPRWRIPKLDIACQVTHEDHSIETRHHSTPFDSTAPATELTYRNFILSRSRRLASPSRVDSAKSARISSLRIPSRLWLPPRRQLPPKMVPRSGRRLPPAGSTLPFSLHREKAR